MSQVARSHWIFQNMQNRPNAPNPETPPKESAEMPPQAPQEAAGGDISGNSYQRSGSPQNATESAYDEKSIRILDVASQRERFSFAAAEALAEDYPHVPVQVIHRMLTAAMMSGTPRETVVARYLDGNRQVQISAEFVEAYRELMNEARR